MQFELNFAVRFADKVDLGDHKNKYTPQTKTMHFISAELN